MVTPLAAWLAACLAAAAAPERPLPLPPPPVGAAPCIACRGPALDPATAFSAGDWAALQRGAVLSGAPEELRAPGDSAASSVAASLVERPPGEVWSVLTDFERWPQFMPLLRETRVERREGPRLWVAQKYRVWLYPMRHTTVYQLEPELGRLEWRLDTDAPHDIVGSAGAWELVAVDGGRATLLRYQARIDAGRAVPAFLERMLRERSLGQMLDGLRREVLRRFPEP
ncbi:MAG TPA: SRPBCC family protein [Myxococcota bacterium]|nr:SRPBCC family protein [Myxococcota bacterium]